MQTAAVFDNAALFDPLGHLTDEGLRAIVDGTLDELGRLEASEHLTFCDYCLARYTALIEAMPQRWREPMRDLVPQVRALMRRRSFRILTNRYVSAVAAVALCFMMWRTGVFGVGAALQPPAPQGPARPSVSQTLDAAFDALDQGFDSLLDGWRSGFDALFAAAPQTQSAAPQRPQNPADFRSTLEQE